ncbi:hypothetical protein KKF34_16235 [Myxococcota bacterium]|nr:hypothetical protein [Myxococcota bacterium]MBU1381388.1 hypothetical protein [Myxococcota bacterium]MBU1498426.1 hypothetical protein [Myxococcota bacterium]
MLILKIFLWSGLGLSFIFMIIIRLRIASFFQADSLRIKIMYLLRDGKFKEIRDIIETETTLFAINFRGVFDLFEKGERDRKLLMAEFEFPLKSTPMDKVITSKFLLGLKSFVPYLIFLISSFFANNWKILDLIYLSIYPLMICTISQSFYKNRMSKNISLLIEEMLKK